MRSVVRAEGQEVEQPRHHAPVMASVRAAHRRLHLPIPGAAGAMLAHDRAQLRLARHREDHDAHGLVGTVDRGLGEGDEQALLAINALDVAGQSREHAPLGAHADLVHRLDEQVDKAIHQRRFPQQQVKGEQPQPARWRVAAHLPAGLLRHPATQPLDYRHGDARERAAGQPKLADEGEPIGDTEQALERDLAGVGLERGEARALAGAGERGLQRRDGRGRDPFGEAGEEGVFEAPPRRAGEPPQRARARRLMAARETPPLGLGDHRLKGLAAGADLDLEPDRERLEFPGRDRADGEPAQDLGAVALCAAASPVVAVEIAHGAARLLGEVACRRRRDRLGALGEAARERVVAQLRSKAEAPQPRLGLDPAQRVEVEAPALGKAWSVQFIVHRRPASPLRAAAYSTSRRVGAANAFLLRSSRWRI